MQGHAEKCVEKYLELTGTKEVNIKFVTTPSLHDHQIPHDEFNVKGTLSDVCARIVLNILCFARISRPDTLQACNALSREVSRWTPACE